MSRESESQFLLGETGECPTGARTSNLAHSVDMTLDNILSPISSTEVAEQIFKDIQVNKEESERLMKNFHNVIQSSIISSFENMVDRDDVFGQLNKLDAIHESWEGKDDVLMAPNASYLSSGLLRSEIALEKNVRERNIRKLKAEEATLKEELKTHREKISALATEINLKKRQIEDKLGLTDELMVELDEFLAKS